MKHGIATKLLAALACFICVSALAQQIDLTRQAKGVLPVANGGSNAASYSAPSGTINPLVFFDGTRLSTDATVIHAGYDATNDIFYSASLIISGASTQTAKFLNTGTQSSSGGAGMQGLADSGAAMTNGSRLGFYTLGGAKDAAHTTTNSSSIESFATESWSGTAAGSNLVFSTTANTTLTRSAVLTLGQDKSASFSGVVSATQGYKLNGVLTESATAPTIASGFGTSPSITANGTAAGKIVIGSGGTDSTGSLTMPTAANGWSCKFTDITNTASFVTEQSGDSATSVAVSNYSRTTGLAIAWTAADEVHYQCAAY